MHAIEVTLERVEVARPEAAKRGKPRVHFHEWLGTDPVETPLCIYATLHEPCLP
jgi:hypothetical protein